MKIEKKRRAQAGFTLPEITLVIMLFGFVMLAIVAFVKQHTLQGGYEKTVDNMRLAQTALWEYYVTRGRYPCPANPTLAPGDAGYGEEQCRSTADLANNEDNCTGAPAGLWCTTVGARDGDQNGSPDPVHIGALPFRTIFGTSTTPGVIDTPFTEAAKLDGYKGMLTYAVTEHMTDTNKHTVVDPANPATGAIDIIDENDISMTEPAGVAHYALVSHGDNKRGAFSIAGVRHDDCLIPITYTPGEFFQAFSSEYILTHSLSHLFEIQLPGKNITQYPGSQYELENCDNNDAHFFQGVRSLAETSAYNDDVVMFNKPRHDSLWERSLASPPGLSYITNTNLGHVGVGTLDPDYELHVVGDLKVEASAIADSYCDGADPTTCLITDALGGTGMTCPSSLHVAKAVQDNQFECVLIDWVAAALENAGCPLGSYLQGFSNLGNTICTPAGTPPGAPGTLVITGPSVFSGGSEEGKTGGSSYTPDPEHLKKLGYTEEKLQEMGLIEKAVVVTPPKGLVSPSR